MASEDRLTMSALFGGLVAASGFGLAGYSEWIAREAERMVPPDGAFREVDGARLHYVALGDAGKPAIVMIHGLAGQLRNFSYAMADALADGYRVILVDRPGSGYSVAHGAVQPNLAGQAAMIGQLIAFLGLEQPLVVGHSLGGAVALALAVAHPEHVGGLALIAPLTQDQEQVPAAFRALAAMPAGFRRLMAQTIGTPLSRLNAERTLAEVFAPEPAPSDFATRGGGALAQRPGNIAAAAADLSAASTDMPALVARYRTLAMPVSILFGRDDAILAPDLHGEVTAGQIPGATLQMVAGGHMLPVTQPEVTAAFVATAAQRVVR
ncbi:alpha/beta hydrolase [Sphingomonas sp. GV3]|jgi:pimeloyl-ACP methyl ester carboxylesterase|uniref:alpha/beta fold hydrolase n=1 Tax=Sphingomonas sp. GV3 TaxID=3040671 RepID=UPI00280A79A5|nr:alpha/beta hydrolase [Sphingomonas sp. GV3]